MIARLITRHRDPEYVALHLDERTRDTWVSIRGDRGRSGTLSRRAAERECLVDLQAGIDRVSAGAERLHKLCDRRGRPRAEDHERRVAALARDMFEQLQVVRAHAMRLLDEPTADDAVDIDAEYRVMAPPD